MTAPSAAQNARLAALDMAIRLAPSAVNTPSLLRLAATIETYIRDGLDPALALYEGAKKP